MNTIVTIIVTVGSVCAAILGIVAFCRKLIVGPIVKAIEGKIDEKVDPIIKRQIEGQIEVDRRLNSIDANQRDMQLRLLRLELLNLINNDPTNLDTILDTFDEYKEMGGNHYMDAMVAKWKKSQGID